MDTELKIIWKKGIVAYFKVILWYFAAQTEENQENKLKSTYPVSGLRFEPETFRIRSSTNHSADVKLKLQTGI
jgi:hypothetical protein